MFNKNKIIEWILRIAVFGEFLGHGIFALQKKQAWVGWIQIFTGATPEGASQLLFLVGLMDIAVAFFVLWKPTPFVLGWATLWGFSTALVRPLVGEPFWDFVERWANWGAPLALLLFITWPSPWKRFSDVFKKRLGLK